MNVANTVAPVDGGAPEVTISRDIVRRGLIVAPVLVAQFDPGHLGACLGLARRLHAAGVGAEVFPEAKKIGQQLQHAEKRGFRVVALAGPDERARGVWKIKRLADRLEVEKADAEVPAAVAELLAGG